MRFVRAPMRISYVGGGTDYVDYFKDTPGGVISAAINQYVYVYSNALSDVADENYRFTYRQSESVNVHSEFRHPVVRELLKHLNYTSRVNMGTFADLPSGIGLGGSSAFTVAMARLLQVNSQEFLPSYIADLAIHVERNLLQEPGGYQDQYASAFGGIRAYDFLGFGDIAVSDPILRPRDLAYFEERQLLVWVGQTRNSSAHSSTTIESIKLKRELLLETYKIYEATRKALTKAEGDPAASFRVLSDAVQAGWDLKKVFAKVTSSVVDQIIKSAMESGINTFKLCGAGGSGFVLLMGEPSELEVLKSNLQGFKFLIPKIDVEGCKVLISS
jgi:D-glycero-alpha-D-manno-heptose-7-phosphate kinase